jgi:hypothetical protein
MIFYPVIFLSAFLLFLVQPLIAKQILPWFGGSSAVWTTCMVFFQTVLLIGYSYADWLPRQFNLKKQALVHAVILLLSILSLPILANVRWQPQGTEAPILQILLLLVATVGLPYALLSTTSPLLQSWFSARYPGRDPYRLFAVSNTASLLALCGYPFVVEPLLGLREQAWAWSGLYAVFVLALCALAFTQRKAEAAEVVSETVAEPVQPLLGKTYLKWMALSASGSILLLAVSNHITQNIAGVPLLWLVPLSIYLITFILTFDGRGWYWRSYYFFLLFVALGLMGWLLIDGDRRFDLMLHAGIFSLGLFICCMYCHGELVLSKPQPAHLTRFYTAISLGGALGAVCVGLLAPLLLTGYYETGIALVILAALSYVGAKALHPQAWMLSAVAVVATSIVLGYEVHTEWDHTIDMKRNFYGVLKVKEYGTEKEGNLQRRMIHGAIMHGEQYMDDRWRTSTTSYYTETSGVGLALEERQKALGKNLRVGMVGLGTGTIASYGKMGDVYRFYEIDPAVVVATDKYFRYLKDSQAKIDIVMGDARLSLAKEPPQAYDVLAIDAFSGDSIPAHLLTKEAIAIYRRHLAKDGILAIHVSNRFLDLPPVVDILAKDAAMYMVTIYDNKATEVDGKTPTNNDGNPFKASSSWVLLSETPEPLAALQDRSEPLPIKPWRMWTDDYHNLVQVLR